MIATGLTPLDGVQKIPAGRLLLCTTEVESCEGRKLWMKATVRDGPSGKVSGPECTATAERPSVLGRLLDCQKSCWLKTSCIDAWCLFACRCTPLPGLYSYVQSRRS